MTHTSSPQGLSRSYLGYAMALLFLVNVVNYMDRAIIGVLIEPMRADLGLSDTQIGLMTGVSFALFYAIAGVYLAHLADIRNRTRIIALSLVAWSLMTALTGAAQNVWQLMIARMGVGVGEASVIPTANAMIADYYRPDRRPFALAVFTAGAMLGITAGSLVGGVVAEAYGWRWAFVAAALPGLPLAVLVWLTLRDPERGASDGAIVVSSMPFVVAVRLILSNQVVWLLIVGFSFIVFMLFGVITWLPAFLVRHHGMSLTAVGAWFGAAMGIGTVVGGVAGGAVANRLATRDLAWLTRLPTGLMLLMWPLYEMAIFAPTAGLSLVAVAFASAAGGAAYGPALAAMQTVLPAAARARGAALNGFVANLVGIGGGPLVVGVLSDYLAPTLGEAGALQYALAIAVSAGLVGVVFMLLAHRAFTRWIRGPGIAEQNTGPKTTAAGVE